MYEDVFGVSIMHLKFAKLHTTVSDLGLVVVTYA